MEVVRYRVFWSPGKGGYSEVYEYDNSRNWTEMKFGLKGEVFIKDEAKYGWC